MIAFDLNNLALLLKSRNRLSESETLYHETLEILRNALPAGHPNIATNLINLAELYAIQGKTSEAFPLLGEALETHRNSLPNDSPRLAGQLATVSMAMLLLKAWDEAEPLIREAVTIREKVESHAWTTFSTKSVLGHALLGQGKFAEAEPLLLAGYTGMQERQASIPLAARDRFPDAIQRLVQLYTDWHSAEPDGGYDGKAAKWQGELDKFNATLAEQAPKNYRSEVTLIVRQNLDAMIVCVVAR